MSKEMFHGDLQILRRSRFYGVTGGPSDPDVVKALLREISTQIYEDSGIDLNAREPVVRARPNGQSCEGRMYYRGPRNTQEVASIKLDLTLSEHVVQPTSGC